MEPQKKQKLLSFLGIVFEAEGFTIKTWTKSKTCDEVFKGKGNIIFADSQACKAISSRFGNVRSSWGDFPDRSWMDNDQQVTRAEH